MTRIPAVSAAVICLIIAFSGVLGAAESALPENAGGYNVILIIIDTLRPDHLGCYGYPKPVSPAIDAIARDSFVFDNAFSQSPGTLSSTMSILTSLYPSSHGMFVPFKDRLPGSVKTMGEIFSSHGYKTAWFSQLKIPHLDIDVGFGRGFQDKIELDPDLNGSQELFYWVKKNRLNKFFLAIDARTVHDFSFSSLEYCAEFRKIWYSKIVERSRSRKPVLIDQRVVFAHKDLFNGKYAQDKLSKIRELLSPEERFMVERLKDSLVVSWMEQVARRDPQGWIAGYDSKILVVDQGLLKPLAEELKSAGLYDKTLLIITADHGEALGENNNYGHSPLLGDPAIHVPLIIKIPHTASGRRVKELAQNIDIMPTALELAGIDIPQEAQGKSLAGLMNGTDTAVPHEYIISEGAGEKAIRSEEWKFISGDKRKSLFHLCRDPGEERDIASANKAIVSAMEAKLEQWEKALPSYKDKEYPFTREVDRSMRERIRKTGYW